MWFRLKLVVYEQCRQQANFHFSKKIPASFHIVHTSVFLTLKLKAAMSEEASQKVDPLSNLKEQREEKERKARVDAMWEQMNSSFPRKLPKVVMTRSNSSEKKPSQKKQPEWMVALGFTPIRTASNSVQEMTQKMPVDLSNVTNEETKKLAAAALSAVKNIAAASVAAKGKIEITEVRDFAGEGIEMKKLIDADSKEAAEKAKTSNAPPSALDTILEQIKKKQKLSVLDKTKKDWGEFKEENKGLEEELDAYKKSSNQYLEKVSFLQRTDLREFERERDARLALQAKRRSADFREEDF